jgi:lipopolysaccharide transport system ATP-binding protein
MLRVSDLTKRFHRYPRLAHRLLDALAGTDARAEVVTALDGVSFEIQPGTATGIIGVNGAGKSTLLRMLAGTLSPTCGFIQCQGRIGALLHLGIGFHPDFSGRQNIRFGCRMLGLDDAEIAAREDEIIAFAEVGRAIDDPLRTYSTGMQMRLGFAVAATTEPDLLLIDEVLAVGDARFQQKCVRHLRSLQERGTSVLLVSHDLAAVKSVCARALLLHRGRVIADGAPEDVTARYTALLGEPEAEAADCSTATVLGDGHGQRSGSQHATITAIDLVDCSGRSTRVVAPGDEVEIRLTLEAGVPLQRPTVGILIRDRLGHDIFGTNTFHHGIDTGTYRGGERRRVSFAVRLDLGAGDYTLTAAVHADQDHTQACYDWVDRALVFRVLPARGAPFIGTTFLRPHITVSEPRA